MRSPALHSQFQFSATPHPAASTTTAKVLRPLEVWDKAQPPGEKTPGRDWEEGSQGSEEQGTQRDEEEEGDGEAGRGEGSTDPVCGQHTRCRYLAGRWSHCLKGEKIIPGVYSSIHSPLPYSQMWAHTCMHTHKCAHMNLYMPVQRSMEMYACIYARKSMRACTHTHMHMHLQAHVQAHAHNLKYKSTDMHKYMYA